MLREAARNSVAAISRLWPVTPFDVTRLTKRRSHHMLRTVAALIVVLVSVTAFAADPRIEVRPLPPAGASQEEAAAMEEAARLLGRSISQDVMIGSAGPV